MTITMSSAHSPTFPSLNPCHSSFSNPSVAFPTSQLMHQPFRCFIYVTVHSPTLLSLLLCHRLFTYVTWRAAHATCTTISNFIKVPRHRNSSHRNHYWHSTSNNLAAPCLKMLFVFNKMKCQIIVQLCSYRVKSKTSCCKEMGCPSLQLLEEVLFTLH